MAELEISINDSGGDSEKDFRAALGEFGEHFGAGIACTVFDWTQAWAELMKIMLYRHGPVISQVGSTWLGSLEATQGIRRFAPAELHQLGGAGVFYSEAWKAGISTDSGEVIAIPWFLDTYVIYYRRDLFKKAGVDETRAFESLEAFTETVQKLNAAGLEMPLALQTKVASRANLHNLAGWVWNYGGEFITEDGKRLLLSDPNTRAGLKAYYSLSACMPPAVRNLSDNDCTEMFLAGRAAMTVRNDLVLFRARRDPRFAAYLPNLGVAALPGHNFVGGSSFVIWNHILPTDERLAINFLSQITSYQAQLAYFQRAGFIPARAEVFQELEKDLGYAPIVAALSSGRSFRKFKLWGLVEDRLSVALGQIWQALYAQEQPNIEAEIARVLDPLERRLQLTLSES